MEPFNLAFNTLYFYYLLVIMAAVLSIATYRPTAVEERMNSEEVKAAIGSFTPLYQYFGSGDHFYTTSPDEITTTIPIKVGNHDYKSEGIAAHIYAAPDVIPLYRYYHGGIKDHFYTADFDIKFACGAHGWKYEHIQGYCFKNSIPGINRPLYRYWSDNIKDHFYTTNETEIGVTGNHGYNKYEGIVCYVV